MDVPDRRTRGRGAIRSVARDRDLPTDLTILSERWNTVALLGDSGVVARAATLSDLACEDPLAVSGREVETCRELARRGAPVAAPIGEVTQIEGVPVSLWERVDGVMGEASESAMVTALARIHELGADLGVDLGVEQPWFATIADTVPYRIEQLVDRGVIDRGTGAALHGRCARHLDAVAAADLPGGLVHGDAQPRNAMAVGGSAVWIDFEESCRGPYAWDLACLTTNPDHPVGRVLDSYAEASGTERIPSGVMAHLWALRDLQGITWMLAIRDEREPWFGAEASERLAELLAAADT